MVIWVTGISGAGKTSLCRALWDRFEPDVREMIMLDGDAIRAVGEHELGFKEPDRVVQIQRVQRLATMLSEQGKLVLVAALYANDELLAWNRAHLRPYFEIYMKATLGLVQSRDPKGLYSGAARGEVPDVVGIDIPWHAPKRPDLIIDSDSAPPVEELALQVGRLIPRLASTLGNVAAG